MPDTLIRSFLDWYNEQSGKHFDCEKASERFPDAAFEYALVESKAEESWLALETGELLITDDTRSRFDYWNSLISEMARDLESQNVSGEFAVHLPKFTFNPGDVRQFRETFASVVAARLKTIEGNSFADIGEYMADKFPAWPRLPSLDMIEFHQWGTFGRPDELLVQRMPGNGNKLTLLVSPAEIFKFDNGKIIANEHLKAAKVKGAPKTILFFAGKLPVDAAILTSSLPLLNKDLLSGADEIYIVDLVIKSAVRIV